MPGVNPASPPRRPRPSSAALRDGELVPTAPMAAVGEQDVVTAVVGDKNQAAERAWRTAPAPPPAVPGTPSCRPRHARSQLIWPQPDPPPGLYVSSVTVTVASAGGVGLCEIVQHLSMFDYVALSRTTEGRKLEWIDHLHEHFAAPAEVTGGRYHAPAAPGASTEILPQSLAEFAYPSGPAWRGGKI